MLVNNEVIQIPLGIRTLNHTNCTLFQISVNQILSLDRNTRYKNRGAQSLFDVSMFGIINTLSVDLFSKIA